MTKRLACSVLLVLALVLSCASFAFAAQQVDWDSLYTYADDTMSGSKITVQEFSTGLHLVLPSGADPEAVRLMLSVSGDVTVTAVGANGEAPLTEVLDLPALCGEAPYALTLRAELPDGAVQEQQLTILHSANVASMFLTSDDPVEHGREWVEASPDKTNKATGTMLLLDESGSPVYDGGLTQIKGRGNSTWKADKRPYQIKLSDKADLLQSGDSGNTSKTWVLLTNRADPALIRNQLILDLGAEMGMEFSMESRMIDLYYDGCYRGSYLLAEKVETGSGRVSITDLEEQNKLANPDIADLEALPRQVAVTENGATYTYCEGMASPEDISGGYLLEMELSYRTAAEACYFYTTRDNYVVVKSPEFASREQMDYIASFYQEYEDMIYNGGIHPENGKSYEDYVDLESTASCYLINELSKNLDGFRTSAFLYKDAGETQMHMGPLWDYDKALGSDTGSDIHAQVQREPEGFYAIRNAFANQLYQLPEFRLEVRRQYEEVLLPLIDDILLGDETAVSGALHSLSWYQRAYAQTTSCEYAMWDPGESWLPHMEFLQTYLAQRSQWLAEAFSTWDAQTPEPISRFLDVDDPEAWYYDAVQQISAYGLMQGTSTAVFSPDTLSLRAQVVQVLYNMDRPGGVTEYAQSFPDVQMQAWFGVPVSWAVEQGLVEGYPDGTFRPSNPISRQEFVTILYRHAGSPAVDTSIVSDFRDVGLISAYALEAMSWAIETGIVEGYPGNTLQPLGLATRAEMAAIILRYYEGIVLS